MPSEPRDGRVSLGTEAIIGLVAGLATGAAIARIGHPTLLSAGAAVEVAGTLWINAILMTILPLVVAKLVVSIAGLDDPRLLYRSGWKAAVALLMLLTITAAVAAAVMPTVFAWLPIDPAASASLRGGAAAPPNVARPPTPIWLTDHINIWLSTELPWYSGSDDAV